MCQKDKQFMPKMLGVIGAGRLFAFGESAIFEGKSPRAAMASASKDGELLVMRGSPLRECIHKNPGTGQPLLLALLQSYLNRLHRTEPRIGRRLRGLDVSLGSGKAFQGSACQPRSTF